MRKALVALGALVIAGYGWGSDIYGTYGAKVVWQGKTPQPAAHKKQAQQIEKQLRLVLFNDARYALVDNKTVYEGTWHISNGWFTLAATPEKPGGVAPLVAYKFGNGIKTLTPRYKKGNSYIMFVRKSGSTKL